MLIGLTLAVVIALMVFLAGNMHGSDAPIELVQNGHFGEYTDVTVKEVLDLYYGTLYQQNRWDGGESESGSMIVDVRYFDEQEDDGVAIQFTMLDAECFQLTAFVDPMYPVKESSDLLAHMNYLCLLAVIQNNREHVGDADWESSFAQRLSGISGSSVLYGASETYTGNRADICYIDNEEPLELSAAWLLDYYGLWDQSYYETEPEQFSSETQEPELNLMEQVESILSGEGAFLDYECSCIATIYDMCSDYLGSPYQYAVWDFDNDGEEEIMVEYSTAGDTALIDYRNGFWTAYYLSFRSCISPKKDGTMSWSSGADESGIHYIVISDYGMELIDLLVYDTWNGIYLIDDIPVSQADCEEALSMQYDKPDVVFRPFN